MSDHHHNHDHSHNHGEHEHSHGHEHTHSHTHGTQAHSHPHTHEHTHAHSEHTHEKESENHGHAHGASHDHEHLQPMGVADKLMILAEHWLSHNTDHAKTYETWVERAKEEGLKETSDILLEITQQTKRLNELFEKIKKTIQK